jgi:hypothetical protein
MKIGSQQFCCLKLNIQAAPTIPKHCLFLRKISDARDRVRMMSQAEDVRFVIPVRMRKIS